MTVPQPVRSDPGPAPADTQARALARKLLQAGGYGTLAVLEPVSGHPLASRTSYACRADGFPFILISRLATHTIALEADPRCSLLIGEPGAGDPLAHPRMTLIGEARRLVRDQAPAQTARSLFLNVHPKAALYVDFADFSFWQIEVQRVHLNGGFGKAWLLMPGDLASEPSEGGLQPGSPAEPVGQR